MKKIITLLLVMFSCVSMSSQEIVDYLNVGNTIEFNGQKMVLRWSTHPMELYYLRSCTISKNGFLRMRRSTTIAKCSL